MYSNEGITQTNMHKITNDNHLQAFTTPGPRPLAAVAAAALSLFLPVAG